MRAKELTMRRFMMLTTLAAAGVIAAGITVQAQPYGPGMLSGSYGQGNYGGQGNLNLSTNAVKSFLERMIAIEGNSRLKVGDMKEKDADTIVADIVTKDNSLVQRFVVNRHNRFYRPEEN
jgi:hypothetical protein